MMTKAIKYSKIIAILRWIFKKLNNYMNYRGLIFFEFLFKIILDSFLLIYTTSFRITYFIITVIWYFAKISFLSFLFSFFSYILGFSLFIIIIIFFFVIITPIIIIKKFFLFSSTITFDIKIISWFFSLFLSNTNQLFITFIYIFFKWIKNGRI